MKMTLSWFNRVEEQGVVAARSLYNVLFIMHVLYSTKNCIAQYLLEQKVNIYGWSYSKALLTMY